MCLACRLRLHSPQTLADEVGDLCPGCGSLLEPVGDLTDIVGFQAISSHAPSLESDAQSTHERICDVLTRRGATFAPARPDAQPLVDDRGSSCAVSVSMPPPEFYS